MKVSLIVFLMTAVTATPQAQVKKSLYISNDDHTDYLWTADEAQYRDAFISMLDYYIAQSDRTDSLPSDWQSRFNCDGNFWVWEYEKNKTHGEFQKLVEKIRSGHISVPFNALASCYGAIPTEGVLRGMYYAGYLERKFGLDLDLAVAMEDQTLPLGLSSLWAGSGARYSWKGVCNCISKVKGLENRTKEIYWYRGLDHSEILMKWYSLSREGNKHLGGYSEARDPSAAVDELTALCEHEKYPYRIAGAFGYGWDDLKTTTDAFITTAKEKTDSTRRVIVSNELDFFKAFEKEYGSTLAHESVSYGNEWDLYSASMAEVSAAVKRSVEKLRAAEAMEVLVSRRDKNFAGNLSEMRKNAWMALGIYYEHDWTSDGPVKKSVRAAWQRKIQRQLSDYVDSLYVLSQTKLGKYVKNPRRKNRFYAFNPLGWTRTDFCDFPYSGSGNVRVVEVGTGKIVASQLDTRKGRQFIRILATDVPGVGYKVYELAEGNPPAFPAAASAGRSTIENDFYKVRITDQGVITSLIDKRNSDREWVREVNGRFVNDPGPGTDSGVIPAVENAGPVSVTLSCRANLPIAHNTYITLFKDIPRVEIVNEITQNFDSVQTWAFSYNVADPEVWHEETGAILNAKPQEDGGHYATFNSRLDWMTLNHFADISKGNFGITLSNWDCAFMKRGKSALTNLDTETQQISVLAGGQVDGATLGIVRQDGDSIFTQRFAIQTHSGFRPANSMRFALEHQNPLVAGVVTGSEPAYPEKVFSFLNISDPDVLLWSLKPAEDDAADATGGIIARIWNMGTSDRGVKLSFQNDIISATETTHVETDLHKAKVVGGDLRESVSQQQIKTFRIFLKDGD
jgi:alpha-mannosidase